MQFFISRTPAVICLSLASAAGAATPTEPFETCASDTGATCKFFPCRWWRGGTVCDQGRCLCKPGVCALGGVCHDSCQKEIPLELSPNNDNELTPLIGEKDENVECRDGRCACQKGHCYTNDYAQAAMCKPKYDRKTGSSCRFMPCSFQGPASCVDGQCMCDEGYCAQEKGYCMKHEPNPFVNVSILDLLEDVPEIDPYADTMGRLVLIFPAAGAVLCTLIAAGFGAFALTIAMRKKPMSSSKVAVFSEPLLAAEAPSAAKESRKSATKVAPMAKTPMPSKPTSGFVSSGYGPLGMIKAWNEYIGQVWDAAIASMWTVTRGTKAGKLNLREPLLRTDPESCRL